MKFPPLLVMLTLPLATYANDFSGELTALANSDIKAFTQQAVVIDSIKAQNAQHQSLTNDQVVQLDQQWRAEVGAASTPLITKVTSNSLSQALSAIQESSEGLYTEIFVMDNKGLNVGQSSVTSDYWQGDEAKWQETFLKGASAVHISDIEEDESTQIFQSQVSVSIADPSTGEVIGAVTVGVNVDEL